MRNDAINAVEATMRASAALRKHLVASERVGRRMIRALENGVPISESVAVSGASTAELRRESRDLAVAYEQRRHEMREIFVLAALDEHMTIGEIARQLGVSRQLGSRLVHEAQEHASTK